MSYEFTILIVEDEEKTIATIQTKLDRLAAENKHKLKILTSTNIGFDLDIFRKHHIDAILLDYELKNDPEYGDTRYGDELIDLLPKHIDNLFIALVSGFDEDRFTNLAKKVRDLGFHFDYQCKPVTAFKVEEVYKNIIDFIRKRALPYPLAQTIRAFDASPDSEKLFKIKDFIEAVVKYLTIILITDIAYNKVGTFSKKLSVGGNYTFGGWLHLLKTILNHKSTGKAYFVPEIQEIFAEPLLMPNSKSVMPLPFLGFVHGFIDPINNSQVGLEEFLNEFNSIRNDLIGHATNSPEPAIREKLAKEIKPLFQQFKDRLNFLSRYLLLVVDKTQHDEEQENLLRMYDQDNQIDPCYRYEVGNLMGSAVPSTIKRFSSQKRLINSAVYLSNWLGDFLPLYPFISFQVPELSLSDREIFILDTFTKNDAGDKELVRKSYSNNRITSSNDFKSLKEIFDAIPVEEDI
jgi:CheY-like chemotaxis protein